MLTSAFMEIVITVLLALVLLLLTNLILLISRLRKDLLSSRMAMESAILRATAEVVLPLHDLLAEVKSEIRRAEQQEPVIEDRHTDRENQ